MKRNIRSDMAQQVRWGPARWQTLDAWRGAAVLWMVAFHLCFDLNHWGLGFGQVWPQQNFYTDPFWTWQRRAIVGLFMGVSGMALAARWPECPVFDGHFWRAWRRVAWGALAVSLGSALVFPRSWISFGVLHAVAVAHLLWALGAWVAVRHRGPGAMPPAAWKVAVLGLALVALPQLWQHPVFDSRWTNWTGLVTRLPITEDYVPLAPWAGLMCWGWALGLVLKQHGLWGRDPAYSVPLRAALARVGRHSLAIYLVHQPLLIGGVLAVRWVMNAGTT